jgi:hypothetical protein
LVLDQFETPTAISPTFGSSRYPDASDDGTWANKTTAYQSLAFDYITDLGASEIAAVAGGDFQFGRTIAASERFYLLARSSGDAATLASVNTAGDPIGDYTLELPGDWGGNPNLPASEQFEQDIGNQGAKTRTQPATEIQGITFTLGDFEVATGDLSDAVGYEIADVASIDPVNTGIATPEPASLAMMGLGGLLLLPRRRRRS